MPGKVEKILTWRWKDDDDKKSNESELLVKGCTSSKSEREFFIKWKDQVLRIFLQLNIYALYIYPSSRFKYIYR